MLAPQTTGLDIIVDPSAVAGRVQMECTSQHMTRGRYSAALSVLQTTFVAALHWHLPIHREIVLWWIMMLAVNVVTVLHVCMFERAPPAPDELQRWRLRQMALQGCSAFIFGSCITWVRGDTIGELTIGCFLTAGSTIAAFNLLPYSMAGVTFLVSLWAMPFIQCFQDITPIHMQLAVGMVFLISITPMYVRRTAAQMIEGIERRFQAALYSDALAEAAQRIQLLATRDELTGLCNRREGMRLLVQCQEERCQSPEAGDFGVLMVDIDHFKKINDTHGHAAGDEALREVSLRLQRTMRPGDHLARFGGEEFVVLLRQVDQAQASMIAERLRESVCEAPFALATGSLDVSVSVGASLVHLDDAIEDAIGRADAALYDAKRSGRNRVVCAAPVIGAAA